MELSTGEQKFLKDINDLVIRALRVGATVSSARLVLLTAADQLAKSEPYIKAIAERDLSP